MSENKKLMTALLGMGFATSLVIFLGFSATREIAVVDHFFDFHINEKALREEIDHSKQNARDKERRVKEWVNDIHWDSAAGNADSNDRGTSGPPDRDK